MMLCAYCLDDCNSWRRRFTWHEELLDVIACGMSWNWLDVSVHERVAIGVTRLLRDSMRLSNVRSEHST